MKLSEIRNLLREEDIQLTKSLGQTFLHDQHQLRKIIDLAKLTPAEHVIEIGPGLGPLTGLLLQTAGHVTAIETDRRLIKLLEERLGQHDNFTLQHADAMKLVRKTEFDWSNHKLVANLPYSIASPLLIDVAAVPDRPSAMVVTLQLEVVNRLLAKPGSKDYGVLKLLIGLHYTAGEWFTIPARFIPSQTSTPAALSCSAARHRCCLRSCARFSKKSSNASSPSAAKK